MTFNIVIPEALEKDLHWNEAAVYWNELAAEVVAEFVKLRGETLDETMALVKDADAFINLTSPCSKKVIDNAPKLRIISQIGIGYDTVDVDAATKAGVIVCNTPDYCQEEVSDHAMALLLACVRRIVALNDIVKQGKWAEGRRLAQPQSRVRGQTLGLVGFGRIARALLPKARGFGLKIIVYDPYVSETSAKENNVELVTFEKLLEESDYVSVHTLLTEETRHMFALEQFKKMKPTAFFINTARGGLVDEEAMKVALDEGYIAGAALDVLEIEPPKANNPLLGLDNNRLIITSHLAQASNVAVEELLRRPMEEVVRVLKGYWPHGFINPEVKEKYVQKFSLMKE